MMPQVRIVRLSATRARTAAVAVAALLLVWGLVDARAPQLPLLAGGPNDMAHLRALIDRVRAGEPYYATNAEELRSRGYPTSSPFNWRLPTLTYFQAALPSLRWSIAILTTIGLTTMLLWARLLRGLAIGWKIAAFSILLLTLPVWSWVSSGAAVLHDLWAGQLIALSLACSAAGLVAWSLAAGLAAVLIRELALPYVLVMAAIAMLAGQRRAAASWLGVCGLSVALLCWHVTQTLPLTAPDPLHRGWIRFGGWDFVLRTARVNVVLLLMPAWRVAVIVPVAWAGLFFWRAPAAPAVAATVTAYFAMFMCIGRDDNWYWGLLIGPLLPLGLLGWIDACSRRRPRLAGRTANPASAGAPGE